MLNSAKNEIYPANFWHFNIYKQEKMTGFGDLNLEIPSVLASQIFMGQCIPWTKSTWTIGLGPVQVIIIWTKMVYSLD